jgi:hypothetical protein
VGEEGLSPTSSELEADLFEAAALFFGDNAVLGSPTLNGHPISERRVFGPISWNAAVAMFLFEPDKLIPSH